jgi:hypothetical protein
VHDIDLLLGGLEREAVKNPRRVGPLRHPETLQSPVLDLLQVKYILSAQQLSADGLRLVHDDELRIYENVSVMPRASFVSSWTVAPDLNVGARWLIEGRVDPRRTVVLESAPSEESENGHAALGGSVEILESDVTTLTLKKSGPGAGFILLLDSYYPGWTARVDGKATPVLRADVMFRAVPVTAGEHTIVFAYRPTFRTSATWLTCGGLLALAAVMAASRFRRLD